jgi:hypothetical protein
MLRLLRKPVRGTCEALRSDRQPLIHRDAWETSVQLRVMHFCVSDWMLEAAAVRTEPPINYTLGRLTG